MCWLVLLFFQRVVLCYMRAKWPHLGFVTCARAALLVWAPFRTAYIQVAVFESFFCHAWWYTCLGSLSVSQWP